MRVFPILPRMPRTGMPARCLNVRVPAPFIISIISGAYPCSRSRRAPASPLYRVAMMIMAFAA